MRQRGFTLLEMMLVVLLAGVSATLVMMTFPPQKRQLTIFFLKLLKLTITSPNFSFLNISLLSAYFSHVHAGS